MGVRYVLSQYIDEAMARAVYSKLEDESFAGRIPDCHGLVTFAATLEECKEQVRSTLEEWMLVGMKLGHLLPVIAGIDLDIDPRREPI